jgi:branched-chain amino acid transport system substrate-binding protein
VLYPGGGAVATPEILAGAYAAAAQINSAGGIKALSGGPARPIEIVGCDDDTTSNPSASSECAQSVTSKGVIADMGRFSLSGDEVDVFAKAGIAMVGANAYSVGDFTNPLSFPLGGGSVTIVPGGVEALLAAGAKRVGFVSIDVPAAHAAPPFIKPILHGAQTLVDSVYLPTDPSADLTSYYAKIAGEHMDGVYVGVTAGLLPRVVTGLRQAGYTGLISSAATVLSSDVIKQLGSSANGLLADGNFAAVTTDAPSIEQFNDEMSTYAKGAARDEFSLNAWLSVHLAADVLRGLKTIDKASFAAALPGRKVDLQGAAPPFVLGTKHNFLGFPRLFRGTVQLQKVENGKLVPSGSGFVDLNQIASAK